MKRPTLQTLLAMSFAGCRALDPNYAAVSQPGSVSTLVSDSVQVRQLLADEARRDEQFSTSFLALSTEKRSELMGDMMYHPDPFMTERRRFLSDMARQPGHAVPGQQYFRILEQSKARCANDPISTVYYNRVRVTTGPFKGTGGWVCDDQVKETGEWVF